MRTHLPVSLLLALGPALGLAACGDDPPTPGEVRTHVATDLRHILDESGAATDAATPAAALARSVTAIAPALGGYSKTALAKLDAAIANRSIASAVPDVPGTFDDRIQDLEDHLFTDANYLGDGVFRVPADLVCPAPDGTVDADCAAKVELAELRVRVVRSGSGLQFAIQLDADHDEPLAIDLQRESLGISVDLDNATKAMLALAPILGVEAPNARLAGAVSGKLEVLGTAHVAARFSIDRAVAIAVADHGNSLDGDEALRIASAKARVLDLELDGTAQTGAVDLHVGATAVHTPGGYDLDLPGATASAAIASSGRLSITNIGLGDRTLTLTRHGQLGLSLDLNPDDGRVFAASVSRAGADATMLAVAPKLDARIAIDHAVLEDEAPVYDVTRLVIVGALSGTEDRVEVIAGGVAMTTNPIPYGFTASTGQCITAEDAVDSATDRIFRTFSVGSCR